MSTSRERELVETFVKLSDTLVADYHVVDLVQVLVDRSAELFGATSAGLLLSTPSGETEVLASTDEDSRLIELLQVRSGHGPCVDCFRSGHPVVVSDLRTGDEPWDDFRERALELGLLSVHSVPMRLRGQTIGSLNLFHSEAFQMEEDDLAVLQALADVATIGILHQRAVAEQEAISSQLQRALDSRVIIEQAKGAVAFAHDIRVDEAFNRIRSYARSHGEALTEVAQRIVDFELDV